MDQQRRHPRRIDLYLKPVTVRREGSEGPLFGATLDISVGGVQVTVEQPAALAAGDRVEVLFEDPMHEASGEIRWCRRTEHSLVFGVQFDQELPEWAVAA